MNYFKYKNFKNEINKQKEKAEELYKNGAFVTDCDFDEKVKKIMLEDKFITVIDMHD